MTTLGKYEKELENAAFCIFLEPKKKRKKRKIWQELINPSCHQHLYPSPPSSDPLLHPHPIPNHIWTLMMTFAIDPMLEIVANN